MNKIVWELPAPSSSFTHGVIIELRPQRQSVLSFEYENQQAMMESVELSFDDVVQFRTTYLPALGAAEIEECYDCLVEVEDSLDLTKVRATCAANGYTSALRLFRICFDDGPFYEFICRHFHVRLPPCS